MSGAAGTAGRGGAIDAATLFDLTGRTALVTGGSRGIGRMIAEGFLQAGATVYISSRKAGACEAAAAALAAAGPCHALPANVADDADRRRLVRALAERTDRLDVLVNNAGAAWGAPYAEFPESGFRKVLELNVTALFFLTRDLTPLLAAAGAPDSPARVINVGSMDGIRAPTVLETGTFPYSASKAAVHHLTRSLALELAPRHVTVNAVAPGFFPSKMTEASLERFGAEIERRCPLHRIGRPEDVAGVAIYLASRAGAYTTGAVIPVDGGTSIA